MIMMSTEILNIMTNNIVVFRYLLTKELKFVTYYPKRNNIVHYKRMYDFISVLDKQFNEGEAQILELIRFSEEKWACLMR